MRDDVAGVRDPLQEKYLARQAEVDEHAASLFEKDPEEARDYLTAVSGESCNEATEAYWALGDLLWTKYDEKW